VFLKSLTLKGFKSFADPATIVLEPGVTVVVGPNGSGKSNVVDAVAWVLGAQGPRTVRSSKMEDVIFAGSADRPPLGRAEVSLTIDNRAGRLPGGLAEITITRTLFRSGESEYALNGQPCRLLDIQELLSDSGVGRQQHVIVSQGQLGQILDARPEDRRAVVEEAAGVLKHRRRRERAERRLAATEENLERLGDLVREVRRQIRPLERQAAAAASYAALTEELRALRRFVVGQELAALAERRQQAVAERDRLRHEEATLRQAVAELDRATDRAAAELSAHQDEELVASLTRVQALAERSRGLAGVLAERRRSLARALDAAADVDVVASLEAEAARLTGALHAAEEERAGLGPEHDALSEAEDVLARQRAAQEAAAGELAGLRQAEEVYAEARGRIEPLRRALERDRASLRRAEERVTALERRRAALDADAAELDRQIAAIEAALPRLAQDAAAADATARRAEDAASQAEERTRSAEAEQHRLAARAEAIAKAVDEARGRAGADVLMGTDGVLGTLAELVEVDEGWGAAFEAAAGAALVAVVVEGSDAARRALSRLHAHDAPGAVLALGALDAGHRDAPDRPLPEGAEPVRAHVRPTAASLGRALDVLLRGAVRVRGDWQQAVDLWVERPDLVVVTARGDRCSSSGWTLRTGGEGITPQTAAEASHQAELAAARAHAASVALSQARAEASEAAATAAAARREAERAADRRQSLDVTRRRLASELDGLEEQRADAARQLAELAERVDHDAATLAELEAALPQLATEARAAAERLAEIGRTQRQLEQRRAELAARRRDHEVRAAGIAERCSVLGERLAQVERRLAGHARERDDAARRRQRLQADALAVERLTAVVARAGERLEGLAQQLGQLRRRQLDERRDEGARLEQLRRQRAEADQRLTQVRDRLQRVELDLAEVEVRTEGAVEALHRELGCTPEEAMATPAPELPDGADPLRRVADVEAELAALGPVNPLALEELGELQERHRFLEEQVEDVRAARRELRQVIEAVDDEIVRLFAEAFADVNDHFQQLVATLFPGGTGRLVLTDPDNLLDTGIEVEARPSGKNVRKLSLLSGGERSLVALAFLFAVFRSRPSPFYLMDEVEAALDDVNLQRFLDLLHEFRGEAQLIIVSHQKRTMEAADALYGVTMQPGGSSKVVSQKVRRQDPEGEPSPAAAGT